ncbi:uncharacterized protein [Temnothorax nylanderi]|uniref:uncharacterized protein isoform X2 n=1 Tax=Temnothorax nylanderi TaxID=102681 RepID=UPI003A88EE7E
MLPGKYYHLGIEWGIIQFLSANRDIVSTCIQIQIGIDGLPISRSNSNQLWPILGRIMSYGKVFLIGCYFGKSKPEDANEFLQQFVNDINILIDNGITYNGIKFSVSMHSIVCDAPAKSFITLTKGHTGYFSCTKCIIEGDFIANRVCFPDFHCQNRTDRSFRNQDQEEHHLGRSVLLDIKNFNIISQIPLDPMHMIFIGMKKIIKLWLSGPLKTRFLTSQKINNVSKFLLDIRPFIPREFARKPQALQDVAQWKATEFRQFLLYTGPVVLHKELPSDIFSHFLCLHVAVRILSQKNSEYIAYAENLLYYFVKCFITIYGPEFVSHNIHGLVHITDCVKQLGPLDTFSAFPFENFMKELKSMLRKSERPLEQISNRYAEMSFCENTYGNKNVSKICVKDQHDKGPLVTGNDVVCLENIATTTEGTNIAIGRKFMVVEELYNTPCSSVSLGIFKENTMSSRRFVIAEFTDGIQVVPTVWFESKDMCKYPTHYKTDQIIRKAVEKEEVPSIRWTSHKVIRTFGKYSLENAYEKLEKALYTSDLDTEKEGKEYRKKRAAKEYSPSWSESEEERHTNLPSNPHLSPKVKRYRKVDNNDNENIRNARTKDVTSRGVTRHDSDGSPTLSPKDSRSFSQDSSNINDSSCERKEKVISTYKGPTKNRQDINRHTETSQKVGQSISTQKSKKGAHERRELVLDNDNTNDQLSQATFEYHLTRLTEEITDIKDDVEQRNALLDILVKRTDEEKKLQNPTCSFEDIEDLFPMKTTFQVMEVEEILNDPNSQRANSIRAYVQSIGGSNVDDAVKRSLYKIFSNKLAGKYNWEGRRGKAPLHKLALMKLIFRSVLQNVPDSDQKKIQQRVMEWFRHSKARSENEEKRNAQIHAREHQEADMDRA